MVKILSKRVDVPHQVQVLRTCYEGIRPIALGYTERRRELDIREIFGEKVRKDVGVGLRIYDTWFRVQLFGTVLCRVQLRYGSSSLQSRLFAWRWLSLCRYLYPLGESSRQLTRLRKALLDYLQPYIQLCYR